MNIAVTRHNSFIGQNLLKISVRYKNYKLKNYRYLKNSNNMSNNFWSNSDKLKKF